MQEFKYSDDILRKISSEYPDQNNQKLILDYLSQLRKEHDFKSSRVERCILFLANGDIAQFIEYSKKALEDWRDVIVWAEYDKNNNRIYDFNKSFEENKTK